jgi:mono/diheme cytochrome c family protein
MTVRTPRVARWLAATSLTTLVGCGAAPHTRGAGALSPMSVRAVVWNATESPLGKVRAVADAGGIVTVFGDAATRVLSSGAVVATDPSAYDWVSAGTIRSADGEGQWIVGIDYQGRLHYIRGLTALDDVSARYGLEGRAVHGVAMLDADRVGFLLDGEIAVADRGRVTRYATNPWRALAGGGGSGVGVAEGMLLLFDASTLATRAYALPGVTGAALGPDGRLYAATARALYATTPAGDLSLLYDAERSTIHGLVASGSRLWFADGTELGVIDGNSVSETKGVRIPVDATLAPSPSGDVWVLAAGSLQRFTQPAPDQPPILWSTTLEPIFARVCSSCHQPGGAAGVDLSTAAAWDTERANIRDRVLVSKTMPPEGHPLAAADRAAIGAWAAAAPPHGRIRQSSAQPQTVPP